MGSGLGGTVAVNQGVWDLTLDRTIMHLTPNKMIIRVIDYNRLIVRRQKARLATIGVLHGDIDAKAWVHVRRLSELNATEIHAASFPAYGVA
jgi:hypothetical protein